MKKSHLIAIISLAVALIFLGIHFYNMPTNPQGRDIEKGKFSFYHYSGPTQLAEALQKTFRVGMSRAEVEAVFIGQGGAVIGSSSGTLADRPQDAQGLGFGSRFDRLVRSMPLETKYTTYFKEGQVPLYQWAVFAFYNHEDRLIAMTTKKDIVFNYTSKK